jgi:hypothetical protein
VIRRKAQTIINIRDRQKRKANEKKKDKLVNKLANVLSDIIGV